MCNHENDVPSPLTPQWLCGNSSTWAHYIQLHHVSKCMSCHKAIVVITGRANCFHDCIYIMPILLLPDLSTLCVVDHLWPLHIKSLVQTPNDFCLCSLMWVLQHFDSLGAAILTSL